MKRIALVVAASLSLAAPVAAQSLNILLPTLTFPTDTIVPSTKGCAASLTDSTCTLAE